MNNDRVNGTSEAEAVEAIARGLTEVLRVVHFSKAEEWIEELELQASTLVIPWVRCTALFKWDSQIQILQHVTAYAGFWGQKEYVELRDYCGQRTQDGPQDATDRYQAIRKQVETACARLRIQVRGGYYPAGGGGGKHA
jgi:hypothetical protein